MIPPFTGNGMTMAFQSGIAAAEFVAAWSLGKYPWEQVRANVEESHRRLFSRRLRWAIVLQSILIRRPLRRLALGILASGLIPFDTLYHKVR
jgi:flavin-dependent dehydrogenase